MCGPWAVSCKCVLLVLGGEGVWAALPTLGGEPGCGAAPMRKSSCALPRGFAGVAERQGEGSERPDPAQPRFGAMLPTIPGMLLRGLHEWEP